MSCERANVQSNVEKARLINRRTYLRTEKRCEDVRRREKRWEEKRLYECSN